MKFNTEKLKKVLISGDYLKRAELDEAETKSREKKIEWVEYLLEKKLLTKDLLGEAIAESEDLEYVDLRSNIPSHQLILKVPEDAAREYRLILFQEDSAGLSFATDDPAKAKLLLAKLQTIFKPRKIFINYSLTEDVDFILSHFYRPPLKTRFSKIIAEGKKVGQEITAEILKDALVYNSSDIHFEPQLDEVVVRFRVDGVLQEAGRISKDYYYNIVNFIKVQSGLRIDEHFAAQDGSMRYSDDGRDIDLRVSILPLTDGEKVVIRILTKYVKAFTLSEIGLEPADQAFIEQEIKRPFGMIISAGPTGSGKTTTLYSILKILNNPEINITTLEDPVEYRIEGVNQIQVNTQTNLTFSKGLRSIVRQDPDIIMIGEIRDRDTAEISVNAALTGHLLLSTFHANDAETTITRLLDMGVEPFLLASTLKLIVAQRLVRRVCPNCTYKSATPPKLLNVSPAVESYLKKIPSFYRGRGCEACGHTGYKGRIAIFEIIIITPEIQDLILRKASAKEIWDVAKKQGVHSLFSDGMQKVKKGITSLEEVLRVANP